MKTKFLLLCWSISFCTMGGAFASTTPDLPLDPHYCNSVQSQSNDDPNSSQEECTYNEAVDFIAWKDLSAKQAQLLEPILVSQGQRADASQTWQTWTLQHNDFAAAYLAITHAVSRLTLLFNDGSSENGLDLIKAIREIHGDRIKIAFNADVMNRWKNSNGMFRVSLKNGSTQTGHMSFANHTVILKGELIDGYDFQWFSGVTSANSPRFHFNFRLKDGEGDMHLDVAVWIWGFILNPTHMTYAGSDPRQSYDDYVDRYGDPGFRIQERIVEPDGGSREE